MDYLKHFNQKATPQFSEIPGREMIKNSCGAYVFEIDKWKRLERFLILGTEGGTYYAREKDITIDNAKNILHCIEEDGLRVVDTVSEISNTGRAPKNGPAIFVLALCLSKDLASIETRRSALDAVPKVVRTGRHLFQFVKYMDGMRGWGKILRKAVSNWYTSRTVDSLAYQVVKYRQGEGWTHRDIIRMSHPSSIKHNPTFRWITRDIAENVPPMVEGYMKACQAKSELEIRKLIMDYRLPFEAIPTEFLKEASVWRQLLINMLPEAMMRNLGRMTANGAISGFNEIQQVVKALTDEENIRKFRIHPINVLIAMTTYATGRGVKGGLTWTPISQIIDALDEMFYLSFGNIEATNKNINIALDVSTSMEDSRIFNTHLSPRVAEAAMAMVHVKYEPFYTINGFSHEFVPLSISKRQRLDDVVRYISSIRFGATDCSLPMTQAIKDNRFDIDAFIIYTDNETNSHGHYDEHYRWIDSPHPAQALQEYRQKSGRNTKLIVCAMTATDFSIADPNDSGMLDVVGFDSSTPNLIHDFILNG